MKQKIAKAFHVLFFLLDYYLKQDSFGNYCICLNSTFCFITLGVTSLIFFGQDVRGCTVEK